MPEGKSILIVGAGPTGLTAAIELARRGHRPRIISANEGPVHESRALGVNRRSLDILAPSGATERLLARGHRIRALNIRTADRLLVHAPIPESDGPVPVLAVVPQSAIEEVLVETLGTLGIAVEWRTALTALDTSGATPRATIAGPNGEERVEPDILVGADGAHSKVRHEAGIGFPGGAFDTEWGLADCRVATDLALDEGHVFDLAPVLFVILPIRDNLVRFICDHSDVLAHVPPQVRVESVAWESNFRISHRQAESYSKGGVFLAGDAAHIHSPVGARGMNLGIEDAAWLAWMIGEGTTDGYSAARWPVGRRVIRTVDPATRLMASDSLPLKLVRRHVLPHVMASAPLRRRLIGRFSGLDEPPPPWLAAE